MLCAGAFLGTPAVNVGTRQGGREYAGNVIHADYDSAAIRNAIERQLKHGRYPRSTLFGDGHADKRIADILARTELRIQKRLHY